MSQSTSKQPKYTLDQIDAAFATLKADIDAAKEPGDADTSRFYIDDVAFDICVILKSKPCHTTTQANPFGQHPEPFPRPRTAQEIIERELAK